MVKAEGPFPRPWGRDQTLGGVAKDVGASQGPGGVAKALGAWPRPWGRGQGLVGVAKVVGVNPNPNPKAVGA